MPLPSLNEERIIPSVTEQSVDEFTQGRTEAGAELDQELNNVGADTTIVGSTKFETGRSDQAGPISDADEATAEANIDGGVKPLDDEAPVVQNRAEANDRPVEEQS